MSEKATFETSSLCALDIETTCRFNCETKCDHALTPHTSRITVIGIWSPSYCVVFRDLNSLRDWLSNNRSTVFVGHNFKFDIKQLRYHGIELQENRWVHDTSLMATASYVKISQKYLDWYEARRKEENKKLSRGHSHRKAGKHSLKTLAPYFLGVDPFWETPDNHDNDEYVLKDCEYTYRLYDFFAPLLKEQDTYRFYEQRLLPWAKMFLRAEERGVKIDLDLLEKKQQAAEQEATRLCAQLMELWKEPAEAYLERKRTLALSTLEEKHQAALLKLKPLKAPKDPAKRAAREKERLDKLVGRYEERKAKALASLEPFSIDSNAQLLWLLRDYYGLPVKNFEGKESTGVAVLKKLAKSTGRSDIELLLEYRKQQKLATSFYPSYKEMNNAGTLHCNFNLDVTKTGRTSSSNPNLQQVPGDLHDLFVARPGYQLITRDLSGIEPALIAYYSEDPALCDVLLRDGNFHSFCAQLFFGLECSENEVPAKYKAERKAAKFLDLSRMYGSGVIKAQQTLRTHNFHWTEGQTKERLQVFDARFSDVKDFKRAVDRRAEQAPIKTMFGFKRDFTNDVDNIYMQAFNGLIQGSAGQLLLAGAKRAQDEYDTLGLDAHVLLFVHDECVVEAREEHVEEAARILEHCMTDFPLDTKYGRIPLKVEGNIASHWSK